MMLPFKSNRSKTSEVVFQRMRFQGEAKEIQETTNALMDEIKIMAKSYLMAYFQFS